MPTACELAKGGVWKELQGSSCMQPSFFSNESHFECQKCQDIFLEFEFDPVASASIAQVLDAFVNVICQVLTGNAGRQQRMEIVTHRIALRDILNLQDGHSKHRVPSHSKSN